MFLEIKLLPNISMVQMRAVRPSKGKGVGGGAVALVARKVEVVHLQSYGPELFQHRTVELVLRVLDRELRNYSLNSISFW